MPQSKDVPNRMWDDPYSNLEGRTVHVGIGTWLFANPTRLTSPAPNLDGKGERKQVKPNMHATQRMGATTGWMPQVTKYRQEKIAMDSLKTEQVEPSQPTLTPEQLRRKMYER